jgi:hypothetical protein
MTENEAIKELEHSVVSYEVQNKNNITCDLTQNVLDMATQTLEEIQQYRAIGTIEEFKALKDKGVAKKPKSNKVIFSSDSYAYCPHCKGSIEAEFMKPRNCRKCGGELDWQ